MHTQTLEETEKMTSTKAEQNATHSPFVYQLYTIFFNIKINHPESKNVILLLSVVFTKLETSVSRIGIHLFL